MKLSMKKLIYMLVVAAFLLTACGKDTVETVDVREQDNHAPEEDEGDDEVITPEDDEKDIEVITPEKENAEEDNLEEDTPNEVVKNDVIDNDSSLNQTQTPGTITPTPPPSDSGTTPPPRKPDKSVLEETKTDEVAYKYGVTKYDIVTKRYMLYSDGTRELLDSTTDTYYNATNYSATNDELKAESASNTSAHLGYYQEVLRLVNEIRAQAGVDPLTLDTTLCQAASMRAIEMDYSDVFSHTRPNGESCFNVLDYYNVSYYACGENIAAGQVSPASVVNAWKNSPGHYANMINASYTKLGVGYSCAGVGAYRHYWCQLFAG